MAQQRSAERWEWLQAVAAGLLTRARHADGDQTTTCPLCGQDVLLGGADAVRWHGAHHAHLRCALQNVAARLGALERRLDAKEH